MSSSYDLLRQAIEDNKSRALRRHIRDMKAMERHAPIVRAPWGTICEYCFEDRIVPVPYPCNDMRDLADEYEVVM